MDNKESLNKQLEVCDRKYKHSIYMEIQPAELMSFISQSNIESARIQLEKEMDLLGGSSKYKEFINLCESFGMSLIIMQSFILNIYYLYILKLTNRYQPIYLQRKFYARGKSNK